jgi:hypothetical protein
MMTFQYPPTSPILSFEMRSANLGNVLRKKTNVETRKVRGGEVKQAAEWPILNVYTFEFKAITWEELKDFRQFLTIAAGLEIRIIDWDSVEIDGVILSPIMEGISTLGGDCTNDISQIEFLETP